MFPAVDSKLESNSLSADRTVGLFAPTNPRYVVVARLHRGHMSWPASLFLATMFSMQLGASSLVLTSSNLPKVPAMGPVVPRWS